MIPIKDCYEIRFSTHENKQKNKMWKILCASVFQQYISNDDVVMDMGAGYCEFINNIKCGKKIAVDVNPDLGKFSNKNVEIIKSFAEDISSAFHGKINKIFMSNFLEHLNSKEEIIDVLNKANKLLKRDGEILILQPNIDLVKEKFWNFIDHKMPLNESSLREALEISNFKVEKFIRRFLPYTTKSSYPKADILIKLYLALPQFLRPFAGQSFIAARKINNQVK